MLISRLLLAPLLFAGVASADVTQAAKRVEQLAGKTDKPLAIEFRMRAAQASFIFDRDGKLVAQAIDMRTGPQFLEMLKKAGIE